MISIIQFIGLRLSTQSLALALFSVMAFAGCVSETRRVSESPPVARSDKGIPLEVLRVPQEMQNLSGVFLRYHAKHHRLPETLIVLADSGVVPANQFAGLSGYAYHPKGLGVLRDGRTVLLVDRAVRIESHLWCIIREPTGQPMSITLNVTPVSLADLEDAARRSR